MLPAIFTLVVVAFTIGEVQSTNNPLEANTNDPFFNQEGRHEIKPTDGCNIRKFSFVRSANHPSEAIHFEDKGQGGVDRAAGSAGPGGDTHLTKVMIRQCTDKQGDTAIYMRYHFNGGVTTFVTKSITLTEVETSVESMSTKEKQHTLHHIIVEGMKGAAELVSTNFQPMFDKVKLQETAIHTFE